MFTYLSVFLGVSCLSIAVISGCTPELNIENQTLRDRVYACSAGFSEDIESTLKLAYERANLQGGATADFKEETRSVIFSEIPERDRLKAYEYYINCIEQQALRKAHPPVQKKYISRAHQRKTSHLHPPLRTAKGR